MRPISCTERDIKDSKYTKAPEMPGWFDRVRFYPDSDKKRLGPCKSNLGFYLKKPA